MIGNGRGDRWVTRFGLIMAMAGNAVGLGNFLRFPGLASQYGGAFMVPYFLALVLLGIPLMWMEWTIGRHGGHHGHGSTPGMLHRIWQHPISKYLGVFGILLPATIGLYYIYIESWCLGYAWLTLTGQYWGTTSLDGMKQVFVGYQDAFPDSHLGFTGQAYLFFLITFALNMTVFARGISKGIEVLARYGMPLLIILGVILSIRVLTLPPVEGRTVSDGLADMWVVDWSRLQHVDIWIAAAAQIFFTLSLGLGMIHTYASYVSREDDITLNGLATTSMNELVEVIIGGTIAIPAAVLFFGVAQTRLIATGSIFDLGFQVLPVIFQQMPAGQLFGVMWFLLLFLAGMTSSIAMFTPLLLFVQEELGVERRKAVMGVIAAVFLLTQPIILTDGVLGEVDYWASNFLVVFGAIEAVIFAWCFGLDKGWLEMHQGAELRVPRIFYYIMKYVTPVFLIGLLAWWVAGDFIVNLFTPEDLRAGRAAGDNFWTHLTMVNVAPAERPYLWSGRIILIGLFVFLVVGVRYAWRHWPQVFEEEEDTP